MSHSSQPAFPSHSKHSANQMTDCPVIVVTGPTATGKTALSVALAEHLQTEIISADSQLLYRHLNIGTAKPTPEEQRGIPHHMIDVANPDEAFSAAAYQSAAEQHLAKIWASGRIPVVAGGTGFYLRALLQAKFIPNVPPNPAFRQELHEWAAQNPAHSLHQRLQAQDPVRAAALHPNDHVRIIRALEIIQTTGQPVPNHNTAKGFRVLWLGLTYENRDSLRARIDQRITEMMAQGWLAEVESLVAQYGPDAHALGVAHGYPELVQVVQGQRSLEDALAQVRINIHQYARRQMTWFRQNQEIQWLTCDDDSREAIQAQAKAKIAQWQSLSPSSFNGYAVNE